MAQKRTADSPPFTPAVFRWARDRAGYSLDDAAEKLAVSREILLDWESDDGIFAPTVKQARDLAALYGRSFLEWSSDAMEAQAFAYLAARREKNLPITFPMTTGVDKPLEGGLSRNRGWREVLSVGRFANIGSLHNRPFPVKECRASSRE
jgi:transcriptional regulator with XRE-family HTH domain